MDLSADVLAEALREALDKEPRVVLAFLFGSQAAGRASRASDVDVAVYLDPSGDEDLQFREIIRLRGRLEEIVGAEVDLVSLNTAAPAIASEALRGRKLVIKNERLYLDLLCEKTREAEDLREWTFDLLRLRRQFREEARREAATSQRARKRLDAR